LNKFYNFSKPTFNYFGEVMKNLSPIPLSTDNLFIITQLIKFSTKRKYCPLVKIERDYNIPSHYIYPIGQVNATIQYQNLNNMVDDYIIRSYTTELGDFIVYNLQETGKFAINLLHFIAFSYIHIREKDLHY